MQTNTNICFSFAAVLSPAIILLGIWGLFVLGFFQLKAYNFIEPPKFYLEKTGDIGSVK